MIRFRLSSRGEAVAIQIFNRQVCFQSGLRSNRFADIASLPLAMTVKGTWIASLCSQWQSVIASEWNERGDPDS